MSKFANRRVVVSGGSRGIGFAISQMFAREGAGVVFIGRNSSAGYDAERQIRSEGGDAHFLEGDISKPDLIPVLIGQARELLGGDIDTLCHSAGIYPTHPLTELTLEDWNTVLTTNLTSAMLLTQQMIQGFTRNHFGRVICVSSITGPKTGISGLSHYGASKGGLEALSRALAVELGPIGVTVNCVAPGTIETETLLELYPAPEDLEVIRSRVPVGKLGKPDDIAEAVKFLASTEAGFVTGISVVVDGGQTLPEVQ